MHEWSRGFTYGCSVNDNWREEGPLVLDHVGWRGARLCRLALQHVICQPRELLHSHVQAVSNPHPADKCTTQIGSWSSVGLSCIMSFASFQALQVRQSSCPFQGRSKTCRFSHNNHKWTSQSTHQQSHQPLNSHQAIKCWYSNQYLSSSETKQLTMMSSNFQSCKCVSTVVNTWCNRELTPTHHAAVLNFQTMHRLNQHDLCTMQQSIQSWHTSVLGLASDCYWFYPQAP